MIESESEMGPSFSSTKMAACGEKAFPSVPSLGILVSIQGFQDAYSFNPLWGIEKLEQ